MKDFSSLLEPEDTTQNLEHADDAKDSSVGSENHTNGHDELSLSVNQLNQGFLGSLDLKSSCAESSPIELNDGSNLSVKQPEVSDKPIKGKSDIVLAYLGDYYISHLLWGNEFPKKETKRRHAMEMGTTRNENDSYLDLKLSPPGVYLRGKPTIESKSSSSTSQDSCVSAEVDSNVNPENPPVELSPLIVMGCTHCHLYVMVPDADPRCPKCKNSGLLDIFRGNQTKRSKKN